MSKTSSVPTPRGVLAASAAGGAAVAIVLAVLGGWTFWGKVLADHLRVAANPNRLRFYVLTLCFEWFLFALVVAGVRRSGAPLMIVLGDRDIENGTVGARSREDGDLGAMPLEDFAQKMKDELKR